MPPDVESLLPTEEKARIMKSFVFGFLIALMGCFYGFDTSGGAEGVGAATTRAVVASCVLILISDYVLAILLFQIIFNG